MCNGIMHRSGARNEMQDLLSEHENINLAREIRAQDLLSICNNSQRSRGHYNGQFNRWRYFGYYCT